MGVSFIGGILFMDKITIGYLGPAGTFTEVAVKELFGHRSFSLQAFSTIEECMEAAQKKLMDYTVVPIENSIGGSVSTTLDRLIHELEVPIQGEVHLPIHQQLLVHPKQKNRENYTHVFSHPQALKQCSDFLSKEYPGVKQQTMNSTAEAARVISENPDKPWLAIANSVARNFYKLEIKKENIETFSTNMTRFVVLSYLPLEIDTKRKKASIIVSFPQHDLMILHDLLSLAQVFRLKPTKIESAPMKTGMGEYFFFIDFEITNKEEGFKEMCRLIEQIGCNLRILGCYPSK